MPTDRIASAVEEALREPEPNPWMATLSRLWAYRSDPTDAEIGATWTLLEARLTELQRSKIEERIRLARSGPQRKRLRAKLKRGITAPEWPPTVGLEPGDSNERRLLESYTVDVTPEVLRPN